MDAKKLHRVGEMLRDLAITPEFAALNVSGASPAFRRFAVDLDHAILRVTSDSESPPPRDELRGLLTWLLSQCVDELVVFRPGMQRVIELIDK